MSAIQQINEEGKCTDCQREGLLLNGLCVICVRRQPKNPEMTEIAEQEAKTQAAVDWLNFCNWWDG